MALVLAACNSRATSQIIGNDAYIWQRNWQPSLLAAIQQSADTVHAWHVLAAEASATSQLVEVTPNWQALTGSKRPVIMVIRIDGQLVNLDEDILLAQIADLAKKWRSHLALSGIEIDHDCASAKLTQYALFLSKLHRAVGQDVPITITALPAWLDSKQLDTVLSQATDVVLQVHAVRSPHLGLFDKALASGWVHAMSQHGHPFHVALPSYGSRVSFDQSGALVGVESEVRQVTSGVTSRELMVSPQAMSDFVAQLRQQPVPNLVGIVWFRLPTDSDQRAWSLATWLAVVRGETLPTTASIQVKQADDPNLYDVSVSNPHALDVGLPTYLQVANACEAADGVAGYQVSLVNGHYQFSYRGEGLLHAGQRATIGWVRCRQGAPKVLALAQQ